jgi:hypothetical protein
MTFYLGRRIPDKPRKPVGKKKRRYLVSFWGGLANKTSFDQVENFCMFIGYPRSGHTLVGSLLDAHPNIILADELNALKFIEAGFSERQIFYLLLRNSRRRAPPVGSAPDIPIMSRVTGTAASRNCGLSAIKWAIIRPFV